MEMNRPWPPSWKIPTSKETLVLVEDFLEDHCQGLSLEDPVLFPVFLFFFRSRANSKRSSSSFLEKS